MTLVSGGDIDDTDDIRDLDDKDELDDLVTISQLWTRLDDSSVLCSYLTLDTETWTVHYCSKTVPFSIELLSASQSRIDTEVHLSREQRSMTTWPMYMYNVLPLLIP